MNQLRRLFHPVSLGIAVCGSGLTGIIIVAFGLGSIFSRGALFGLGVGLVLVGYGAMVTCGALLMARRVGFSLGLVVAPALLHLATLFSLMSAGDLPQTIGAALVALIVMATLVGALWPATRAALGLTKTT